MQNVTRQIPIDTYLLHISLFSKRDHKLEKAGAEDNHISNPYISGLSGYRELKI